MKKMLRFLRVFLTGLVIAIAAIGALFGYFVYSPDPELPHLAGTLAKGSMEVDGLKRTYRTYVPGGLKDGAPLVVVMHGSGENGAQVRMETGYEFDRLADQHGFAVVYPDSYTFDWNDCSKVGDFRVKEREVDDVSFLIALVDKQMAEVHVNRDRVFATGISAGGFMSIRLALEAPSRFRAVAAVAANVPVPANFKCQPATHATSVMIMNGTRDPLVPFDGGEVNLLGFFYSSGTVRSSLASAQYFADLNRINAKPESSQMHLSDDIDVEHTLWRNDSRAEVELVAIRGVGHGLPQAYWRRPRLLGPSPMQPDGPALIWAFFDRQTP
jgi:polyhydroxybutyrate depolymerase